ncbi:MAG: IS4 family transposase [Acidobacteriales bacterium]|nr:IS4 family transposase [Terriglobales bacterium]
MNRVCSIFAQMMSRASRMEFEALVKAHPAERHARGFACWTQFLARMFCQLGQAPSLAEITGGLAASEGKLRHLGVEAPPKKSTLAYAIEHRPWQLYQSLFERLYRRLSAEAQQRSKQKFRFKNKLLSVDATLVPVSLSAFDWARYRRTKAAAKLHLVLDHDGCLPRFAVVTEGKTHETRVTRQLDFEPGTMVVMDRGSADANWFLERSQRGVRLVTRLKDSAEHGIVENRPVPANSEVIRDEVILRSRIQEAGPAALMRRIRVSDQSSQTGGPDDCGGLDPR